jgi:phage terminase small subunit
MQIGNASEAYRQAYKPKQMTARAIGVEGSRLINDPRITLRIAELRAPAVDGRRVTLMSHLSALNALREKAEAKGHFGAASASALPVLWRAPVKPLDSVRQALEKVTD